MSDARADQDRDRTGRSDGPTEPLGRLIPSRDLLRRRRPVVPWLVALLTVVAFVVVTLALFVSPAADDPASIRAAGPVDAVVVLGGSPDDRYDAAIALATTLPDPPPTIALAVQYDAPVLVCGSTPELPDAALECFSPEPATTSGEAVWIAREAQRQGWRRVVVATSDYHVTRARVLVERCVGAISPATDVRYLVADTDATSLRGLWRIATEWPSLLGTPWDHRPDCEG